MAAIKRSSYNFQCLCLFMFGRMLSLHAYLNSFFFLALTTAKVQIFYCFTTAVLTRSKKAEALS
jgi:hypothetical protein